MLGVVIFYWSVKEREEGKGGVSPSQSKYPRKSFQGPFSPSLHDTAPESLSSHNGAQLETKLDSETH